jgi:tetratricopeptide (TPR) repeat protein
VAKKIDEPDDDFKDSEFLNELEKLVAEPNSKKLIAKMLLEIPSQIRVKFALKEIEEFLELNPDDFDSLLIKCKSLRLLQRNDDALALSEELDSKFPDNPDVLEQLGRCYFQLDMIYKAKKILDYAFLKFHSHYGIGRALTQVLDINNEFQESLKVAEILLEKKPDDEKSVVSKIIALVNLDKLPEAIQFAEDFEKNFYNASYSVILTVGLNEKYNPVAYWKSFCYLELAVREMYSLYPESEQKEIQHHLDYFTKRSAINFTYHMAPKSRKYFEKTISSCNEILENTKKLFPKPNSSSILFLKGRALHFIWKFNESFATFDEVLTSTKNASERITALYNMGLTKMNMCEFSDAVELFDQVLDVNPEKKNALLARLACYAALFDKKFEPEYERLGKKNFLYQQDTDSEDVDDDPLSLKNITKNFSRINQIDIDPNNSYEEHNLKLHIIYEQLGNSIFVVDKLCSPVIFKYLQNYIILRQDKHKAENIQIKILMRYNNGDKNRLHNMKKEMDRFKNYFVKCDVEIRVCDQDLSPAHDRYWIGTDNIWQASSSDTLKKQDIVTLNLVQNPKTYREKFYKIWEDSNTKSMNHEGELSEIYVIQEKKFKEKQNTEANRLKKNLESKLTKKPPLDNPKALTPIIKETIRNLKKESTMTDEDYLNRITSDVKKIFEGHADGKKIRELAKEILKEN